MGLAMGLPPKKLGFGKELVDAGPALSKIGAEAPKPAKKERPSKEALPMPTRKEDKR
jgi:hypothetical protein